MSTGGTTSSGRHPVRDVGHNTMSELRSHFRAVRRFWRSVAALTLIGIAVAGILTFRAQPQYESTVTFFAASAATDREGTALQADEFAQRRVNSYVGVVQSERLARIVLNDTGLKATVAGISSKIQASVDPETVLLNVQVVDSSERRSLLISRSIAQNLDAAVAELDSRGTRANVELQVISGPTLNPFPVSPRPKLNLALGLLLGLGAGLAQAILRQQLDMSVRTSEQLAETTGYPVLGVLTYDRKSQSSPILTPTAQQSHRAESFRQLRTNLRFVDAARTAEVVVVTSSVEGEGKTTTAANLAVTFAESGRNVLLVDADLRKPKLENYLDLEGSAGLTSILIGEADIDDVAQEWGTHGLNVLASGPIPPNPSELLGSSAMEKLMQELRSRFEMVIIDTPPLLPVTDAAVISTQADGIIVVVRHGVTRRDHVQRAINTLESVDARILGNVLSMAPSVRRDRQPAYYQQTP